MAVTCYYCFSQIDARATHCPHCRNPQGSRGREAEQQLRRQLGEQQHYQSYQNYGPTEPLTLLDELLICCIVAYFGLWPFAWIWNVAFPSETLEMLLHPIDAARAWLGL